MTTVLLKVTAKGQEERVREFFAKQDGFSVEHAGYLVSIEGDPVEALHRVGSVSEACSIELGISRADLHEESTDDHGGWVPRG